jgi:hypothetical protein
MTRIIRFPLLTFGLTTAFCATTLSLIMSTAVTAQGISVLSTPQSYYSAPQSYYSAQPYSYSQQYYGAPQPYQGGYHYNSFGPGYGNVHQSGYRGYGSANFGSTVYVNGPYLYGSRGMFPGRTSLFQSTSYAPATPVIRYGSPVYAPASARYYSPYGYQRY